LELFDVLDINLNMNYLNPMISIFMISFFVISLDVESVLGSTSGTKNCPFGYIIDKNGFCDPDTTSNIRENNLMNETEIPDNRTINKKPITNSTDFEAILLAANGVPPVTSTASAKAHFGLDDTDELTVPSFSLEGRELIGIIAVHIHAGNNTENGPIVLTLREYNRTYGLDAWDEQLIASGPIKPEDFEGPLRGKTIADLIELINAGRAYVDIHTYLWSIPELRGTISPNVNTTSGITELQSTDDLRKLGYNDGCLDARNGIVSSSLSEKSNTYRLGYKEGHDACSGGTIAFK
jgi:CHRD domain